MLINNPDSNPAYIVITLRLKDEPEKKAKIRPWIKHTLFALHLKFTDQQISLFTMYANVFHSKVILPGDGLPATFIVIESREIRRG